MNLDLAKEMTNNLMSLHGIGYWNFKWNNAKRIGGQCAHHRRQILLSKPLTELRTEDNVRNTILHEIAHALVGRGHGHNHVWRAKAIEIGCDGDRCWSDKIDIATKYVGECPTCDHIHKKHRLPKGRTYSCNKCNSVHDPNNIIVWRDTKTGEIVNNKNVMSIKVNRGNVNAKNLNIFTFEL